MKRKDFQDLAYIRLKEAETLLEYKKYEGAYYLCGYVIEFALKACIAKKTNQYDFPDKRVVNASYTHDLNNLLKIAGLGTDFNEEIKKNKNFESNWGIVKNWTEASRYEKHGKNDAEVLFYAITENQNGVLQWIKKHW